MRWTQLKLLAWGALLCTIHTSSAGAQTPPAPDVAHAPAPAPAASSEPVVAPGPAVDTHIKRLYSEDQLRAAGQDQLASWVESATASQATKEVIRNASLKVLAASKEHRASLAQARSLVDEYKQALLAAASCTADCESINAALKQSAEQLSQALRSPYYVLKRDVYTVTLSTSPIVRIQCSVANDRGSDAVVFDPQDARGLVRHAVLPHSTASSSAAVSCTSDRLQGGFTGKSETAAYFYVLSSLGEVPTDQVVGCWRNSEDGGRCAATPDLTVTIERLDAPTATTFLQSFTTISPQSTLRSFDPSTLALDLIKVLGTVALERANEGLKHYVRSYLLTQICENLTVEDIIKGLGDSPLYDVFKLLPKNEPVLATTCSVLESIRIDELASAKDVLWKALMADSSRLAFRSVLQMTDEGRALDQVSLSVFEAAHSVLARSLLGEQTGTERDVQAMLLSLERMKPGTSALRCGLVAGMAVLRLCLRDNTCSADELNQLLQQESPGPLATTAGGGLGLRELAQGLVYDQEESDKETKAPTPNRQRIGKLKDSRDKAFKALRNRFLKKETPCDIGIATAQWPALRPLLGKIGDVLQPPPGATASATTANALEIVTDIAQLFLDESLNNKLSKKISQETPTDWEFVGEWRRELDETMYSRATVDALRLFIGVLRGEDPAPAVAELGKALSGAIKRHCEEREDGRPCKVPVTSAQINRAFTVLTAISSYAASYRAAGKDGEVDEAAREQERKKALESVIDAFTDRSHRGGETVFSLGADVGFQFAGMATVNDDNLPNGEGSDYVHNPFSMPMGLALQRLPDPQASGVGCHIMATVIDPAQYATMSSWDSDAKFVRATPATAVRLGLRGGLLLGEPGFPISIVGHVSYSPALELWPEAEEGAEPVTPQSLSVWMYGISAGIYVPFLDFN